MENINITMKLQSCISSHSEMGFFWSTYHVLDLKLDVIVVNRDHLHSNPHTNGQIMHILSASLQPTIRDVKHFILDMHVRDKH